MTGVSIFLKKNAILLAAVVAILALISIGALRYLGSNSHQKESLPGTLILALSDRWNTPSGEIVYGSVRYTPQTGAVSSILSFDLSKKVQIVASGFNTPFSSDGTSVIATTIGTEGPRLVDVNTQLQQIGNLKITAQGPAIDQFPIWSPDDSHVAYLELTSLPLAPDGKSYIVEGTYGPEIRQDMPVPESALPYAYVSLADGSGRTQVGRSVPLAFSPDGKKILIHERGQAVLYTIDGKSQSPVLESNALSGSGLIRISSDDRYVAAVPKERDRVVVYRINWQQGSLSQVGSLSANNPQLSFGSDDALLVYADGAANVYQFVGNDLKYSHSYQLSLPKNSYILRWEDVR